LENHKDGMKMILEGVLNTSDKDVVSALLRNIRGVKRFIEVRYDQDGVEVEPEVVSDDKKEIPNKALWKKVLALPADRKSYRTQPARIFLEFYLRGFGWEFYEAYDQALGETMSKYYLQWASDILDDKKEPELIPFDVLKMADSQLTELTAKLKKVTTGDITKFIDGLELGEIVNIDQAIGADDELKSYWAALSNKVVKVGLLGEIPEPLDKSSELMGRVLKADDVLNIINKLEPLYDSGFSLGFELKRDVVFGGITIKFSPEKLFSADKERIFMKCSLTGREKANSMWNKELASSYKEKGGEYTSSADRLIAELHKELEDDAKKNAGVAKERFIESVKFFLSDEYPASAGGTLEVTREVKVTRSKEAEELDDL